MDNKVKKTETDQNVEVNFESHPPIESDLDGVSALMRQTFLHFVDSQSIARYLIDLKDVTQVIALEGADEVNDEDDDDDDEPDNDIYGVTSVIDLSNKKSKDNDCQLEACKQLNKFLKSKCPELKKLLEGEESNLKLGLIVNERYINLPPQLSLPTFKNLTQHLDKLQYTHLVFVSKIQLKARNTETKLPSKKAKSGDSSSGSKNDTAEPIIFVNPEEEVIFESCEHFTDLDVSAYCDENASWSFSSDIKYIPHRRIMTINYKKWPTILKNLEKELE